MKAKKLYMVLDTETLGLFPQNLVYDIAWKIVDKKGNVYKTCAYLVQEVICNKELMKTAYYYDKLPHYRMMYKQGLRMMKTIDEIKSELIADIKNIDVFSAYNVQFDMGAIKQTFGFDINEMKKEIYCIWKNSAHIYGTRKMYKEYCVENGLYSEAKNVRTNAECIYRYLFSKHDFIEEHTALEDVEIEFEILKHLFRQKQKNHWQGMNWRSGAWKIEI
ncbi:MAG: hypothetical protein ACRCZ0_10930 [Cetobacterium sp.]